MLTSPTPRYTARLDVGLSAAHPSIGPSLAWAAIAGYPARAGAQCSHAGALDSKVALPPAIPAS